MEENGTTATKLFLRGTPRYEAGSRFKYTPDVIDFSYKALVDAICEAIDKQAQEEGAELFTDERHNNFVEETLDLAPEDDVSLAVEDWRILRRLICEQES